MQVYFFACRYHCDGEATPMRSVGVILALHIYSVHLTRYHEPAVLKLADKRALGESMAFCR